MAENGKAPTRTLSDSSRKRTSSLGSHTDTQSSRISSPEQDLHAAADAGSPAAQAWTGPRSGSAPPDRRSMMPTITCESMSTVRPVDSVASSTTAEVAADPSVPTPEARQDRKQTDPQIDKLLLDGLVVAKDRLLLLRADLEMEKLFNDPARTRLRVAPPGFPPNLNSYQRLLIHRLADMWSISRELEPASSGSNGSNPAISTANVGSMISGTIVLVKTDATMSPLVRVAALAPPPSPEHEASANSHMVSLVSKASELTLDGTALTTDSEILLPETRQLHPSSVPSSGVSESLTSPSSQPPLSATSTSSTSPSPSPAIGPVRIMSRAANAAARAALNKSRSPSAGSGIQGMTFEEREAAYQQARMRIFNDAQKPATSPADRNSRPASMPPPQEYQHQHQQQHNQPLMPQFQSPQTHLVHQPQPPPQMQQHHLHMQAAGMSPQMNPALRPSAPVFVYQAPPPGSMYPSMPAQQQPQHFAFYPVQAQSEPNLHAGPPIQVTMPSPAPVYAQQPVTQVAYAAYPTQLSQQGFVSGQTPFPRPTSSHSHSSQSSISTATSQSSIRTASTSSAQRSTLSAGRGYTSPGANLQPLRQFPNTSVGTSGRQVRPTPRPSAGSSSTHSNASVRSRHSQSSSSSPSVAGDSSASVHVASSHTSKSDSSSPDRDAGCRSTVTPEEALLPSPHPTLPGRPTWIDAAQSANHASSSASSVSSASSREHTCDLTEDHLPIQREDTHTPLSSTSGKQSGRGLEDMTLNFDSVSDLASVVEDDQPDARSTPLPYSAPLPFDENGVETSARSTRSDKFDTTSQASSSRSSRSKSTNPPAHVIENPPLRYDKVKGWTMLNSSNLSQINRSAAVPRSGHESHVAGNHYMKPPSPAPSVASSSNWSQHAFQSAHSAASRQYLQQVPQYQFQQQPEGHRPQPRSQHASHQYVMMPVPLAGTQNYNGTQQSETTSTYVQQHHTMPMQQGHSSRAVMMPSSPQPGPQNVQFAYPAQNLDQNGQYAGQPVQIFYQPVQHIQPAFQQQQSPQQHQSYGHFAPQHAHNGHVRGMTPADIMANGEMLYSYDLPRPVPRSGATLFDPNASS